MFDAAKQRLGKAGGFQGKRRCTEVVKGGSFWIVDLENLLLPFLT